MRLIISSKDAIMWPTCDGIWQYSLHVSAG